MAHVTSDKAVFAKLEQLVQPNEAKGRTESAAMLLWFLQTIFRLDDVEAQDAVCDQKHDAGFDAIWVNEHEAEIVVFQSKRKERLPGTLGDTDLKTFVGSLKQLATPAAAKRLLSTTKNPELVRLLRTLDIVDKLEKDFSLRPVFVSNVAANDDAHNYLALISGEYEVDLWDLVRLGPVVRQLGKEWFVAEPISLRTRASKLFFDGPKTKPTLVYAAVPATELVKIPGIEDTRVFAQNVRLGLGRTRVNSEIAASIRNTQEHKHFLTFHNGLTIVVKDLSVRGSTLRLNEYSVCNGCQSLLAFWRERASLSPDLEVLVRLVKVGGDRTLAESIAYRTNNQNAISLRDLSSNDPVQLRLKAEFDEAYGHRATYAIKRGEDASAQELSNEEAGRILLALYNKQPWAAHQKYRIFGDLQNLIFSYATTAAHVRLGQVLMETVDAALGRIDNERIRRYALTRFVMVFLVGELLRRSPDGEELLQNPGQHVASSEEPKATDRTLVNALGDFVNFAMVELNYWVEDHGGDNYDYKTEFKSPKAVGSLRNELLKAFDKDVQRNRASAFKLPKSK